MTLPERSSSPAVEESAAEVADYIFTFSSEAYADASRRGMMRPPDRLLSTLIARPEVRQLLVANPYRSWTTAWARTVLDFPHRFRSTRTRHVVSPLRLARADPVDVPGIERVYAAWDRAVRTRAGSLGIERPRVITASPLVAGFAGLDWTSSRVYYARDDWVSAPAYRRLWPAYEEAYRRIAASGCAVAAVSQEIIDRIEPTGPYRVVPNGIEPEEWAGEVPEAPGWLARIPSPRAIYVGTIDSRLDTDGLAALAQARPELQVVLVGPVADGPHISPLRGLPNIHVHGLVGRGEVVAALRNSELTLLAHRRTPLTEAMSPLKVYEYLAAGKPVLATDLGPVRGLDARVLLAERVVDFIDLVDTALDMGTADETERLAFIDENTWAARHRDILALV